VLKKIKLFSPNNVQLANNPQFGKGLDVKNIFKPYPLITDRNLHPLTECVNHLVQEEVDTSSDTVCQVMFPLEQQNKARDSIDIYLVVSLSGHRIFDRSWVFDAHGST
jgi:hypothetical protein